MTDEVNVLVLTQTPVDEALLEGVRAVSPRVRVKQRVVQTAADIDAADWREVEVLHTTGAVFPRPEQAPRLRWVQGYFAGADRALREGDELFKRVLLTTSSGVHMTVMAEYTLMMMLAHDHRLAQLLAEQADHSWPVHRGDLFSAGELRDKTVGILGYGSIGREVARLAKAFGMRVLAAKRDPAQRADNGWQIPGTGDPSGALPEMIYGLDALDALLPECDYVVVVLPLTPETRHVLNAHSLGRLKPTAFVVNIGRGALIDEPALIAALQAGQLGGAALDVFEKEPLPSTSPLWSLPNVILTPHISGWTTRYDQLAFQLFADNLRRYLAGEALYNQVDMALGY